MYTQLAGVLSSHIYCDSMILRFICHYMRIFKKENKIINIIRVAYLSNVRSFVVGMKEIEFLSSWTKW